MASDRNNIAMIDLSHSLGVYQTIRERIIALEADIDEATLADTVEGLTDIHEILAAIVRSALLDEALADGLKNHIQRLQERLQRLTDRGSERRRIARDAMIEVAIKKVAAPDFTISVRPGPPSLVVVDEGAVPEPYWEAREPRLNRASVITDLKRGVSVPGTHLSNPEPVLSVRVR
jgi:Siphovirus Gp157